MTAVVETDSVVARVLAEVAARESLIPFQEIKKRSRATTDARDGVAALLGTGCSVITEIKRAMPSTPTVDGELATFNFPSVSSLADVARLAHDFESAGAHVVACQTERLRFHGSLEDMEAARAAISVPMLCRDIIVDPYQIHEARCRGADIVPLQVQLLEQARLESLLDRIESLGMTALAEVRTCDQADRALQAGAKVLGVNARDLYNPEPDTDRFATIVPGLPQDIVRVALGGVNSFRDVWHLAGLGADAVLVGEALMSAEDPVATARTLVAAGQHPACPARRM